MDRRKSQKINFERKHGINVFCSQVYIRKKYSDNQTYSDLDLLLETKYMTLKLKIFFFGSFVFLCITYIYKRIEDNNGKGNILYGQTVALKLSSFFILFLCLPPHSSIFNIFLHPFHSHLTPIFLRNFLSISSISVDLLTMVTKLHKQMLLIQI